MLSYRFGGEYVKPSDVSSFSLVCPLNAYVSRLRAQDKDGLFYISTSCNEGSTAQIDTFRSGYPLQTTSVCTGGFTSIDITWGTRIGQISPYCGGKATGAVGSNQGSGAGLSISYSCPPSTVPVGLQGTYYFHVKTLQVVCHELGQCQPSGTALCLVLSSKISVFMYECLPSPPLVGEVVVAAVRVVVLFGFSVRLVAAMVASQRLTGPTVACVPCA